MKYKNNFNLIFIQVNAQLEKLLEYYIHVLNVLIQLILC